MNRRWIHIALAALATTIAQAQTVTDSPFVADQPLRPAMSMFMASVGHASILDSYLSPIRYNISEVYYYVTGQSDLYKNLYPKLNMK